MTPVKKAVSLFFCLAIFAACDKKSFPAIPQLLNNTDVEAGSGQPNNWWKYNTTPYVSTWTTDESLSPKHSLELSSDIIDSVNFAFWAQTFDGVIPVGKDLVLSVKIKGKNLGGQGLSIAIRADDTASPMGYSEQFITTQGTTGITGTFDWTTYTVRLPAIQNNIKSVTIYLLFLPRTTGTAYFDDPALQTN